MLGKVAHLERVCEPARAYLDAFPSLYRAYALLFFQKNDFLGHGHAKERNIARRPYFPDCFIGRSVNVTELKLAFCQDPIWLHAFDPTMSHS